MKSNRKGIVLMDELSLFTLALGLSKPWQVVDIRFSKEEGRLDLRIDFPRGAKFPCPTCEGQECEVHDTKDRTWRHLNFFQYETYLHARVPRVGCDRCGIKQVEVPWARPGSGFTLLFEMLVLQLSREMSVAGVADVTAESANRIWRILAHYVEEARRRVDLSGFAEEPGELESSISSPAGYALINPHKVEENRFKERRPSVKRRGI
jgi:hypothetical protein